MKKLTIIGILLIYICPLQGKELALKEQPLERGSQSKTNYPDADELIRKSDDIKNPHQPFRLENRLAEYHSGVKKHELSLVVFSKEEKSGGQFKNIVIYVEPVKDSGKIVQFSGTTMWFYDPSSKTSIKIPPQQRIVGQASEGDVVTANFAYDYKGKILGEMTLDDADKKSRKAWHLELTPKNESAIYNKIEYWIDQKNYHPIKAKFYSDSGRLLKIAYYHKFEIQMGKERPSEVIIIDGINPNYVTTMNFSNMKPKEIPDSWFQRESMSLIKAD